MDCVRVELEGKDGNPFRAIVCGRGLRARCWVCGGRSERQCDFFVAPPSREERCDRHLCKRHATSLGLDKDACPEHAMECLAAIRRRAGLALAEP